MTRNNVDRNNIVKNLVINDKMTYAYDELCSKQTMEVLSLLQVLILDQQMACGTKIAWRPPPLFWECFPQKSEETRSLLAIYNSKP